MAITLNGTTGITTPDVDSTADISVNGLTVGKGAGNVATNTAVGASALAANTTGSTNTGIGVQALNNNTTGSNNSAVGLNALYSNTTGNQNTAMGRDALALNTTASDNTAVGYQAGYSNTTGTQATYVGAKAGFYSTGNNNSYFGFNAGAQNSTSTASSNSFFGCQVGASLTSGDNNTAMGHQALISNTTGTNNTAIGFQAGYAQTTGQYNTHLGRMAGFSATTGNNNTFVGVGSGYFVSTGAKNTILGGYNGNQGGLDIRTSSNQIVVSDGDGNPKFAVSGGNFAFQSDNAVEIVNRYYTASNATQIGAITFGASFGPASAGDGLIKVYPSPTYASPRFYVQAGNSGGVYVANGATSWSAVSDERKKDIIEPISDAANKVSSLRAVIGKYKTDADDTRRAFLIAQDVQAVLPEAVDTRDEDELGMSYTDVIPLLVAAIKELKVDLDAAKAEIAALKGQ